MNYKLLIGLVFMFLLVISTAFAGFVTPTNQYLDDKADSGQTSGNFIFNFTTADDKQMGFKYKQKNNPADVTFVLKLDNSSGTVLDSVTLSMSAGQVTQFNFTPVLSPSTNYYLEYSTTAGEFAAHGSGGTQDSITVSSVSNFPDQQGTDNVGLYLFNVSAGNVFTIRAKDYWDNSTLNEFSANVSSPDEYLVSYWNMNGNANDIIGGNSGTVNGATLTTGKFEQGYGQDADGQYIELADETVMNGWEEFTFNFYINLTATSDTDGIIGFGNSGNRQLFVWYDTQNGGELRAMIENSTGSITEVNYPMPELGMYNFTLRYQQGNYSIFSNGEYYESVEFYGGLIDITGLNARFGQLPGFDSIKGIYDDFKLYNRSLTDDDIYTIQNVAPRYLHNLNARTTNASIVFNETRDMSGNNHTLTNNGATYDNGAYEFDRSLSNYLDVNTNINLSSEDFNVSAYLDVKKDGAHNAILSKGQTSPGDFLFYKDSANNLRGYINSGSIDLSTNDWNENITNFVEIRKNSTGAYLFVNDVLKDSDLSSSMNVDNTHNWIIGASNDGTARYLNGTLYNLSFDSSSLTFYYPFQHIPTDTIVNATVFKENYFIDDTYEQYNTTTSLLTARLSEAQISLDAQALVTNATVSPANFTIEGQTFSDGELINISAGDYNVTFSKQGWYNLTQQITVLADASQTFTITDVYNSQVNVTFRDFLENNTRTNATGTITNTEFNYSVGFNSTPNFWVLFNWTKDQPLNMTVDNELYALQTHEFTPNATEFNYTFYVYDTNSFFITIRDEVTQEIVNGTNFTVEFISTPNAFEETTTNGTIFTSLLTPTDYELRYYSTNIPNYPLRSAFFTLTNQTFNNITLYTLDESDTNISQATITFRILNADFQPVENAKVIVERYYLSSNGYVSVFERFTNTNGEATGTFETIDAFYKYKIFYNDVLKYTSPSVGTQFTEDETIIKYIDTTTVVSDIIYDIQDIEHTLSFIDVTNTTGYFELNYTNPSLYNICLTVSTTTDSNQTCQATTSGSIQISVTGSNTTNIDFTAIASALSDSIGTYQPFASKIKAYTATPLNSEDVRNTANFVFVLIYMALALSLMRWPIWSLITQTILFVIVLVIPFQLISLTLASGSYFIGIVVMTMFLIKGRGAR